MPKPKDLYVDVMIMKGNPDLTPETTNSFNLEYGFLDRTMEIRASYFYNDIDGFIQEYYNPVLGKFSLRNVKETIIQGSEIKLRKKFMTHENGLTHTFLEAREESGKRLPNRARHHTVFNTTLFFSPVNVSNDISCRKDEILYDENNKLREFSYCSFDLGVHYKISKYQLSIRGINLFNEFERPLPQRPRMLALYLNANY